MDRSKVDDYFLSSPVINYPAPRTARARESFSRRFFKTVFIVSLIWILFKAIVQADIFSGPMDRYRSSSPMEADLNPVPDFNSTHCNEWSDEMRRESISTLAGFVHTSFKLPLESEQLLFLSGGPYSNGNIRITQADDVSDEVTVDVSVTYWEEGVLDLVKVCRISREENGLNGVGIWTSLDHRHRHKHEHVQLRFDVVVHLPSSSDRSPLRVKSLLTDLPLFAHEVGDLENAVNFGSIHLKTAHMPIVIDTLYAEHATLETLNSPIRVNNLHVDSGNLKTANSPIEGKFNTSSRLYLVTANAYIKADVALVDDNSQNTTELMMLTSNAYINSVISLSSPKVSKASFKVTAKTSLSPLNIIFSEGPLNASLLLSAATSMARADVQLHDAYEGDFSLETSFARPEVVQDTEVEDPAGDDRKRVVTYHRFDGRGYIDGDIYWCQKDGRDCGTKKEKWGGLIDLRTSFSPVTLTL